MFDNIRMLPYCIELLCRVLELSRLFAELSRSLPSRRESVCVGGGYDSTEYEKPRIGR